MGVTQSRCEEEEQHTEARGLAGFSAAQSLCVLSSCLCFSAWDLK